MDIVTAEFISVQLFYDFFARFSYQLKTVRVK